MLIMATMAIILYKGIKSTCCTSQIYTMLYVKCISIFKNSINFAKNKVVKLASLRCNRSLRNVGISANGF